MNSRYSKTDKLHRVVLNPENPTDIFLYFITPGEISRKLVKVINFPYPPQYAMRNSTNGYCNILSKNYQNTPIKICIKNIKNWVISEDKNRIFS